MISEGFPSSATLIKVDMHTVTASGFLRYSNLFALQVMSSSYCNPVVTLYVY